MMVSEKEIHNEITREEIGSNKQKHEKDPIIANNALDLIHTKTDVVKDLKYHRGGNTSLLTCIVNHDMYFKNSCNSWTNIVVQSCNRLTQLKARHTSALIAGLKKQSHGRSALPPEPLQAH